MKTWHKLTLSRAVFLLAIWIAVLAVWSSTPRGTAFAAAEPYYQGKRINLLIGTSPGASADMLARVIARYLSKYVPGSPSIIAMNMGGGGSVSMMNHLYNVADRDGTALGIVVGGIYMRHLFGVRGIRHDLEEMVPVYNPEGVGSVIYAGPKLGLKEPADIMKVGRPVSFGYTNPQGNSAVLGQAGFTLLGVPYLGVGGYGGSPEVALAVERGELDTGWNTAGGYHATIKPKVDAGILVPIFQSGLWRPNDNAIVPDPGIPNVPTFDALYRQIKGKDPSGPLWDAWFTPLVSAGRYTMFFPPEVPQAAVGAINAGLEQMCQDPQFQADFRRLQLDPKCYLKDDAKRITQRSSKAPSEAVEALKNILPK